jgi:uncharacterized membrane-anchored protein YitT (DUF2179 family)
MVFRNIRSFLEHVFSSSIWRSLQRLFLVALGALISALGYSLFQVPFNIVAGGLTGIGIIINHFSGLPVGMMYLLMNIPLLILGYSYLGRWRFILYTLIPVVVFSIAADFFTLSFPEMTQVAPLTDDMLLSAIYAGLLYGIGSGLIYRAGGTPGGTAILGRILQYKTGLPLSQLFLYTDSAIILVAGIVFGWDSALHALLTLFLMGMASDFVLEGPSNVRTAMIITSYPEELSQALTTGLRRSLTFWSVTGSYSRQDRSMLFCTVQRSQVSELKYIIAEVDPTAFVVIENAHQAMGTGFMKLKR